MQDETENTVLITQEVCEILRISRPTCLKYFYTGRIKGIRAGKGWRVLKSELNRFLQGDNERKASKESLTKRVLAVLVNCHQYIEFALRRKLMLRSGRITLNGSLVGFVLLGVLMGASCRTFI
jgi:excisionase family DNA binding protein